MEDAKNIVLLALVFAIACGVAGVVILVRREAAETTPPSAKVVSRQEPVSSMDRASRVAPPKEVPPAVAGVPSPPPTSAAVQSAPSVTPSKAGAKAPSVAGPHGQGVSRRSEPLQDPMARVALALVGSDPIAEAYWCAAINDPNMPAKERQDLIEDLNEDGLSDPKHPSPEDLPVILKRLGYIEALGPYAMDKVNADAFAEAYKDLVNLANLALGGGKPVR